MADALDRRAALIQLESFLSVLSPDDFPTAVADAPFDEVTPLVQNHVAASVERAAYGLGAAVPPWVATVPTLDRPYFGWELRSLRPHLMRVSPVAFKRRHIFVAPTAPSEGPSATTPGEEHVPETFRALNAELARRGVEVELCLVGGAVMVVAFNANAQTRRVRALFASSARCVDAAATVAARLGAAPDWLNASVRQFLVGRSQPATAPYLDTTHLKVYEARPEYVLAMKVAALDVDRGPDATADIRYLLRFLDLATVEDTTGTVGLYFRDRQLPEDAAGRLGEILA
ncbi:MAG: hypothetical protein O2958_02115 [Gemmatimonadetes bacterium]|nr:hypothetical protein [Gemmatimonadota bacterium]MDA1102098.1 hypothetical protein [Gemmatimonadota bacterium]